MSSISDGLGHISVENMRNVQWGLTFEWAIIFPDAPSPFNVWFPATSVEETIFNVEKIDFTAGLSSFSIPKGTSVYDLRVSIVDGGAGSISTNGNTTSSVLKLHSWFKQWGDKIINLDQSEGYVATISEISRKCVVSKFNGNESVIETSAYYVYPHGTLAYRGSSDSGVATLDIDFVIAGRM